MYRLKQNHHKAIEMFKRMLQKAWSLNKLKEELNAYKHLSIEYYYLENMDKSNYYNDRYQRGKFRVITDNRKT